MKEFSYADFSVYHNNHSETDYTPILLISGMIILAIIIGVIFLRSKKSH